jgi:hypothetical protein
MEHIIGKYDRLFSIKILHPWFTDNICPYITIEADPSTKKIFRRLHLIDRMYPGEMKIISEINEVKENNKIIQQPANSFDKNQHLVFLLKLTNPQFFDITKLDFTGFPKQVLYFSNNSKAAKLSVEKCVVTDGLLNMSFEKGKVPVKEKIITSDNREIFQTNVNKNATGFKFDLSANNTGLYSLVTEFAKAEKTQTQTFYYNPFVRREPIFGVIDINTSGINTVNDDKNIFIISFEKKEK